MSVGFTAPWVLVGAISALAPWLGAGQRASRYSSLRVVPDDRFSRIADRAMKIFASLSLLALIMGVAGPYLRAHWQEKIGTGAQIVLLVDRSSSMSDNFAGRYLGGAARETKSAVARQLLAEFVARRRDDLFGIVTFSAAPIYVLPLTQDRDAVLAAIASASERGHGVTNIASGLVMALDFFADKPITGSRIVLLVSDGAARIEEETRARIRQAFVDSQARLYWIYLRNPRGARLDEKPKNPGESTTPEYFLHEFFRGLGAPYRAYEAENPDALGSAIADVGRLENEPLHYMAKLPRKDLSSYCYVVALLFLAPLLASRALEFDQWRS